MKPQVVKLEYSGVKNIYNLEPELEEFVHEVNIAIDIHHFDTLSTILWVKSGYDYGFLNMKREDHVIVVINKNSYIFSVYEHEHIAADFVVHISGYNYCIYKQKKFEWIEDETTSN